MSDDFPKNIKKENSVVLGENTEVVEDKEVVNDAENFLGDKEYDGEPITMDDQLKEYINGIDSMMYLIDGSFQVIESEEKDKDTFTKFISDVGYNCIHEVYPYSKKEIPKELLSKVEYIEDIMPGFCNDLIEGMDYLNAYSKTKNVKEMELNLKLAREKNSDAYDKSILISKLTEEIRKGVE